VARSLFALRDKQRSSGKPLCPQRNLLQVVSKPENSGKYCASDCSENPFACSLQKIATESAPGAQKCINSI